MAFSTAGGGPLRAEINITPMIDILLVLIIVFMVVVSMSQKKGLDAQIPQPSNQKVQQPERTIVIQIAWAGDKQPPLLKVNDEAVQWEKLHDRISEIFTARVERVAFVKSADDVEFQYVANAIDIARGSGVQRIGLLDQAAPESP